MSYTRLFRRDADRRALVITGGHNFDGPAFYAMLDDVLGDGCGIQWTHVEHPAAMAFIENPGLASRYDLLFFYDVPGLEYREGGSPEIFDPTEQYKAGFEALLETGKPMFFLHHAFIGWPSWSRYADVVGGCFMNMPGYLRGRRVPDGGYRFDVTHRLVPVADHPILAGLEEGFQITDQLYLAEVFEEDVTPLMRSDYPFEPGAFYSAQAAAEGRPDCNEGWERQGGSNLMAWVRHEKNSPIMYLQCGDGPSAYTNAGFRRLVENGVNWLIASA